MTEISGYVIIYENRSMIWNCLWIVDGFRILDILLEFIVPYEFFFNCVQVMIKD